MKKYYGLGMLLAVATTLVGGCEQKIIEENVKTEVSTQENEEIVEKLLNSQGEEVKEIKTTYYDSSLFRHLSLDNPYWEKTGLQTKMIESAQTVFIADVEDELENALVDNSDVNEESTSIEVTNTNSSESSNNNSSSSSNTTTKPSTGSGSSSSSSSNTTTKPSTGSGSSSSSSSNTTTTTKPSNGNGSSSSNNNSSSGSNTTTTTKPSNGNGSSSSNNSGSSSTPPQTPSNPTPPVVEQPQPTPPPVVEETKKPVDILDWEYIKSTLIAKGESLGMRYEPRATLEDGYESPWQSSYMPVTNEDVIGYIGTKMERCANSGQTWFSLEMVVQADGNVLIYLIR